MAYVKNNWVDREGTTRYFETVDDDGALIFTPDYTQVTELGTPVNADNMNHIEEGVAAGSFTKYDTKATYALNDLVTAIVVNELRIYKSLQDNNNGNDLTDSSFWEEVEFSGMGGSGFNLFDTKISDNLLKGETAIGWALQGSYVNGAVYPDFYAKCLEEYNEATETEIVNGVTVKVSANGHKFFDIADKVAIDGFFNTMGSAWFYGIDQENERIFLPRDKYFAVKGIAPVVGNGISLGLTNGTTNEGIITGLNPNRLLPATAASGGAVGTTATVTTTFTNQQIIGVSTDPTKSGIEAHLESNEDKYLYICVGNTIVNEDLIDVSKVLSEAVLRSSLVKVETVIETYVNGTSWYRIWSDGWCEQGGYYVPTATTGTITLLKAYKDTDYSITTGVNRETDTTLYSPCVASTKIVSSFSVYVDKTANNIYWQASGYIW